METITKILTFVATTTWLNQKRLWWKKWHQKRIWWMCLPSHCLDQGSSISWTWSSLLKSNSLLERAAWWLMVKLASSPIRSQGGECWILASNLWTQESLKSCHDFGHRGTIGLAVGVVFWDGKLWHDLGNHDAIQQLPHQVSLKGTGHNGCSEKIVARLDKIVTRFWTFVTSI